MGKKGKEITEKIKTFEDACLELRIPVQEISVNDSVSDIGRSLNAFYQLCIIVRALNEGWTPDWEHPTQMRWFNWFYDGAKAGLAFSITYYSHTLTISNVGELLSFKNKKLADYAAVQFKSIYHEYLLIKK